jgi:hypothetical protein
MLISLIRQLLHPPAISFWAFEIEFGHFTWCQSCQPLFTAPILVHMRTSPFSVRCVVRDSIKLQQLLFITVLRISCIVYTPQTFLKHSPTRVLRKLSSPVFTPVSPSTYQTGLNIALLFSILISCPSQHPALERMKLIITSFYCSKFHVYLMISFWRQITSLRHAGASFRIRTNVGKIIKLCISGLRP